MTPNFGYGKFGEFIFYSHYSRVKENGSQESWTDVVVRVIEGVMSIRKDWYYKNHITWDEASWQLYAKEMAISLFRMEWMPPGRGLWSMGTRLIYERGSMALFNCAFTSIAYDWIDDLCWLMDALMHGVGVGFEPIRQELELFDPVSTYEYVIPDTREGWVESIRLLLQAFAVPNGALPIFDYDFLRPEGAKLKTFGGTSSGPGPLKDLHTDVMHLCYQFLSGRNDPVLFKTDLANLVGVCVVTGNVRRSAEIGLCPISDPIFTHLKDYTLFPERERWGWMSNNSVKLESAKDFDALPLLVHHNLENHDIGYVNMVNLKAGRVGKDDKLPEDSAVGINPCQPGWAIVLTPVGLRKFNDVNVGDPIWSECGWTRIIAKNSSGLNKVYKYTTTAGIFNGTSNHQILTEGFKVQVESATSIDILKAKELETVDHDSVAIMDGLLIGDGTYHENEILLNIGENDSDYWLSEIRHLIGQQWNKYYQFKVLNTKLVESDLPLTYNRKIPDYYYYAELPVVASFLRGLYSANGSICGERITLKATSFKIIEQVQTMLSSLGIQSYWTKNKSKYVEFANGEYECRPSYDLAINGDRGIFYRTIGFIQKYKTEKVETLIKINTGKPKTTFDIISIDEIAREETFNITVDNATHTYWTQCCNVANCGEVPLESRECCNIAETLPTRCLNHDSWLNACEYATFYTSTVNLLPTHQPTTNAVILKNRRIGVSIVDFTGWKHQVGVTKITRYLREGYARIRRINRLLAQEAGIPESNRVTTVKPGGTTPKVAGRQAGMSHPNFTYMIRRVRVQANTELEKILQAAGIPNAPDYYSKQTTTFEFPVFSGYVKPADDVSIWEQAMNLILLQREWADNAVSNTLVFKDSEVGELEAVLGAIAPLTKSVSLMRQTKEGVYKQMPEQGITKEEYERRRKEIVDIDWTTFHSDGQDEKFCTSDRCEVLQ
jgi:hypothetical protein